MASDGNATMSGYVPPRGSWSAQGNPVASPALAPLALAPPAAPPHQLRFTGDQAKHFGRALCAVLRGTCRGAWTPAIWAMGRIKTSRRYGPVTFEDLPELLLDNTRRDGSTRFEERVLNGVYELRCLP